MKRKADASPDPDEPIDEKLKKRRINLPEKCIQVLNINTHFEDTSEAEIIAQLQNNIIDLNMIDDNNVTLLMYSACKGYFDLFTYLISNPDIKKDILTINKEKSVIHFAVIGNNKDILQKLLDNILNIEAIDKAGNTPLHVAAKTGNIEIVKLLLKNDANIEARTTDENEATPLHLAVLYGHIEVVKLLLENGANIEATDEFGCTPLYVAVENGRTEVVKLLLENDANIEAKPTDDNDGRTPLHAAASWGHTEVVKLLLENSANIEAKTAAMNYRRTPLHLAASEGHTGVVQLLLEKGADIEAIDSQGYTPLYAAACKGNKKIVKLLINNGAKSSGLFGKMVFERKINLDGKIKMLNFLFKLGIPIELYNWHLQDTTLAKELKDIIYDLFLVDQLKNQVKGKLLLTPNACQDLIAKRLEILLTQQGLKLDYTNYKEYIENIDEAKLNLEIKQTIIKFVTKHQKDISIYATAFLTDCYNINVLPLESYATCTEVSKNFYLSIYQDLGIIEVQKLFDIQIVNKLSLTEIQKIIDNFNLQVINKYFAQYVIRYGIDDNSKAITKLILPSYIKNNITGWIKEYQEFTANSIAGIYREGIEARLQAQEQVVEKQEEEIEKLKNSNQELKDNLYSLDIMVKKLIETNSTFEPSQPINSSQPKNKM